MAHASHTEIEEMDGREAIKEKDNYVVVEFIKGKLNGEQSGPSDCSFGRVPKMLFKQKPEAYKPQMVSIGPFHHGQKHLQPMEARKMQYLHDFLDRSSPVNLENYVEAVTDLAERAYQCYPEMKIKRNGFVIMMVVDGCFILELLLKLLEGTLLNDESMAKLIHFPFLDLILLENQLPFFVLEELYRVYDFNRAAEDSCSLQKFLRQSFVPCILGLLFGKLRVIEEIPSLEGGKPRHLLDFVRQFLIPSPPLPFRLLAEKIGDDMKKQIEIYDKMKEQKEVGRATKCLLDCASPCVCWFCGVEENNPLVDPRKEWNVEEPMLCATKLKNGNVKFEINKNSTCLSNIKFDNAKGVLTVTGIVVQDLTDIIFRNLLAYETYIYDYSYITEYIVFLARLINSGKDVELLQESGILKVPTNYPKDVANLFNDLTKYIPKHEYFTAPIHTELMKYYNKRCHRWIAGLRLNYFYTPCSSISVVAAIILLVLTVMQTIYAALSYHY